MYLYYFDQWWLSKKLLVKCWRNRTRSLFQHRKFVWGQHSFQPSLLVSVHDLEVLVRCGRNFYDVANRMQKRQPRKKILLSYIFYIKLILQPIYTCIFDVWLHSGSIYIDFHRQIWTSVSNATINHKEMLKLGFST